VMNPGKLLEREPWHSGWAGPSAASAYAPRPGDSA
jgi:hypothetical protein